jgi:DNA-directed RNA polymerase sigma subunit (sigma70/sigma32)
LTRERVRQIEHNTLRSINEAIRKQEDEAYLAVVQ